MIMYSKMIEGWIAFVKHEGENLYVSLVFNGNVGFDKELRRAEIFDDKESAMKAVKDVDMKWQYEWIRLSVYTTPND